MPEKLKFESYQCFVCGDRANFIETPFKKKFLTQEFVLLECKVCNNQYTNIIPSNNFTWSKLYEDAGADKIINKKNKIVKNLNSFFHQLRRIQLNIISKKIFCYLKMKKNLKILDYGTGDGYFANYLLSKKHDVFACDINIERPKTLNERVKYFVSNEVKDYQHSFDLIILRHVLEHCPLPKKLIEDLNKKLTTEGIIYFEVPNHDKKSNIFLKLFKSNYTQLGLPHHINHFNERNIKKLFDEIFNINIFYVDLPVLGESICNLINIGDGKTFGLLNILFAPIQKLISLFTNSKIAIGVVLKKK